MSWAKLVTLTKAQRDSAFLKLEQARLAIEHEELIKAAKAERKAAHIANMQRIADAKRRR
jgi:4'-phosphopantetheinyl transferase EntD